MSYDLIIRGGTVVDGTRLPRLRAGAPADIVVYDLEKLRIAVACQQRELDNLRDYFEWTP